MIISERIFKILKERNLSQKAFSEKTGIAQSTISDWKRKKTNPAADKIMIICDVLEITPYELLSGAQGKFENTLDYVVIPKNSEEHLLIEDYRSLSLQSKERIIGFIKELKAE